jgi:ankyrin repeat protein
MVRLLLRKGADIAAKDDTDGETALHRAAEGGHKAVVYLLLERGTDIAANDECGLTAVALYGRMWARGGGTAAVGT